MVVFEFVELVFCVCYLLLLFGEFLYGVVVVFVCLVDGWL